MVTALVPIDLPRWAWERTDMRQALSARDIGAVFRYVQQYAGASQARIATAVDMTQGRVNEIINGRREVTRLDVYERVADGLAMPDDARHLLGLAPRREQHVGGASFDLAAAPEAVRVYSKQAAAAEEIRQQARSAAALDVLAVRGLGLIGLNDSLLRVCLTRDQAVDGACVRVLLLDPESPAILQRSTEIGESPGALADGIRLTEARLRELAGQGYDVQAYRYRTLPVWRVIRADSTMFVGAFGTGWEGHESATYKIVGTTHGPLYRGFRRLFEAMVHEADRTV